MNSMLKIFKEADPQPSWYKNGLNFKCTECGKCCTGSPGYVWVTENEIINMANFLDLSIAEFSRLYVRRVNGRLSLIENSKTYDCVFLKDKKCILYTVRPTQCRTFPWWPQNLKSENDWKEAAQYCEGISMDAPLVSIDQIEKQLAIQQGKTSNGDA